MCLETKLWSEIPLACKVTKTLFLVSASLFREGIYMFIPELRPFFNPAKEKDRTYHAEDRRSWGGSDQTFSFLLCFTASGHCRVSLYCGFLEDKSSCSKLATKGFSKTGSEVKRCPPWSSGKHLGFVVAESVSEMPANSGDRLLSVPQH